MTHYAFQMTGVAHAALGTEMQDRLLFERLSERVLAVAAADGMGSCERASEAAEVAVEAGLWGMRACSPGTPEGYGASLAMRSSTLAALSCAANALRSRAAERGCPLSDLGTTLMTAQYDEPEQTLYYAYSGDGGILVLDAENRVRPVVEPQAYGDGVTHDATASDWWRTGAECGVRAFLVCTDGLLDALVQMGEPNELARAVLMSGPGYEAWLDQVLSSTGRVGEPCVATEGVSDDRTLFVCWSAELEAELAEARATCGRASCGGEGDRGGIAVF